MSVIQAGNTTTTALIYTADTTGNLVFTSGGANTVALTIDNTQTATFAPTGSVVMSAGTTAQRPASPANGASRYNTTLNVTEFYNGAVWQQALVTGGSNTYSIQYLIVGGGGGGGARVAGGGGAGGVLNSFANVTSGTAYTITIGAGGAGATTTSGQNGNIGSNTTAFGLTALYGGNGMGLGGGGLTTGGSGGGSAYTSSAYGLGTAGQGFSGASNYAAGASYGGGGGGGAGNPGFCGGNSCGGNGGNGMLSMISGTYAYYAGGGGGGISSVIGGLGGSGGGGNGGGPSAAGAGGANTGGGGGGGADFQAGANGGSGIVIVSYPGVQRGTGGTITTVNGYTIHTFTSSGTFTA